MSGARAPGAARLGWAIRTLRVERGLSQEALGHAARLHRNYVGAIERGEMSPTFRILLKVAAGLDVPLSAVIARFEIAPDHVRQANRRGGCGD